MAFRFRRGHILTLLKGLPLSSPTPLDRYITSYLASNKSIGAHDRREVTDTVYEIIRHKLYLQAICGNSAWEDILDAYQKDDFHTTRLNSDFPSYIRHSFPEDLYKVISEAYGSDTETLLATLNSRAPVTIRTNTLKITPDELALQLQKYPHFHFKKCEFSPYGFQFTTHSISFRGLPEYRSGLFEVQDEGSQLCSLHFRPSPGQQILDICAGAGGKSLAIACNTSHTCPLYLHDIRRNALLTAKKRLTKAGVKNAFFVTNLDDLKVKFDYIVIDTPCSGTGTIRRNPDFKHKFSLELLENVRKTQYNLLSSAVKYLKPDGEIVYMTCSLLPQENDLQVAAFKQNFEFCEVEKPLKTIDLKGNMDGFYCIRLKRRK